MRELMTSSLPSDEGSRTAALGTPEEAYRAIRGKLPWIVRRQQEIEIERAVSRVSGRGFNVTAWIKERMQDRSPREEDVVQSIIWGSGPRKPRL